MSYHLDISIGITVFDNMCYVEWSLWECPKEMQEIHWSSNFYGWWDILCFHISLCNNARPSLGELIDISTHFYELFDINIIISAVYVHVYLHIIMFGISAYHPVTVCVCVRYFCVDGSHLNHKLMLQILLLLKI